MRVPLRSLGVVVAVWFAGLSMAGCAATPQSPTGLESPRDLYREYVNRLAAVDAKGICALFTPDGATDYANAYQAGTCPAAADKAASVGGDLSAELALIDEVLIDQQGDNFARIGTASCPLGRFIAQKAQAGWLFIDYTPQPGGCAT